MPVTETAAEIDPVKMKKLEKKARRKRTAEPVDGQSIRIRNESPPTMLAFGSKELESVRCMS